MISELVIFGGFIGFGLTSIGASYYSSKKKELEADIKKAEIETHYPPEYWIAQEAKRKGEIEIQKAEIEAKAEVEKAAIASKERLRLDERDRYSAERAAKLEFEKTAPPEYWEQLKVAEEEKTKRELNKQRHESELQAAKQHQRMLEKGINGMTIALGRD